MVKFNFGSLNEDYDKKESIDVEIKEKSNKKNTQPKKFNLNGSNDSSDKIIKQESEKSTPGKFGPNEIFDEIDIEIIKLLLKKYQKSGLNILRSDQKNPFLSDFLRLGFQLKERTTFKYLFELGLFEKTKYSGQYKIKENL